MSTEGPKASVAAETARLQARIDELESERESKGSGKTSESHKERDKLMYAMPEKAADEANRLVRALAHALVEHLRSAADVIEVVADEAFKRKEERFSKAERLDEIRLSELEGDVASVLNKGIEKTLDTPRRVLDKFYEVYQEPVHKQA